MIEPEVSITQSQLDQMLKDKEREVTKSLLLKLIHCTDGARYEEDMVDDYTGMVRELCEEYISSYGPDTELEVQL